LTPSPWKHVLCEQPPNLISIVSTKSFQGHYRISLKLSSRFPHTTSRGFSTVTFSFISRNNICRTTKPMGGNVISEKQQAWNRRRCCFVQRECYCGRKNLVSFHDNDANDKISALQMKNILFFLFLLKADCRSRKGS
jgi:hypothetical protein